jgi:hypothetical protein
MIYFSNTEYLQELAEKRFGGEFIYKLGNTPPEGINWMHGPSPGCTGQVVNCAGVVQKSYRYVGFLPRYYDTKEHVRNDYQHCWVEATMYESGRDYTPESQAFTTRMERS